jgi:hypothetical protein
MTQVGRATKRCPGVPVDLATVSLEVRSRPDAPMLVRRALSCVGERLSLDQYTLEDLKLGVTAACNNVVIHAYAGRHGPLAVTLRVGAERIEATVRDHGVGIRHIAPAIDRVRFGLAVIGAVSDRAEFLSPRDGGTKVRMEFRGGPGPSAPPLPAFLSTAESNQEAESPFALSGDAVVTLAPVALVGSVLGGLAATLANVRRFSIERAGQIGQVTNALAHHALTAASDRRISFALLASDGRFEVTLAPLRTGSSGELQAGLSRHPSALRAFSDDIAIDAAGDHESLHVVLR